MTYEQLVDEALRLGKEMDSKDLTEARETAIVERLTAIEAIIGTDYLDTL